MADGYFGRDSGNTYTQPPQYSLQASRFQNNVANGNITRIRVNYFAYQSGTVRLGVYEDDDGVPGDLLVDAGTVSIVDGTWTEITGLSAAVTLNSYYWVCVIENAFNGSRAITAQGSVGDDSMLGIDLGSFTTLPASWGSSDYSDTKQLAIQAYVEEEEAPAGTTNECLSIV